MKTNISVFVSNHALRCMRKYGGFDNYIILTKPENLASHYGVYLQKLMLAKLNDPSFDTYYVAKSREVKKKRHGNKLKRYIR